MLADWVAAAAGIFIYRATLWLWRQIKVSVRQMPTKLFAWRVIPAKRLQDLEQSEKALRVLLEQVQAIEEQRSLSRAG